MTKNILKILDNLKPKKQFFNLRNQFLSMFIVTALAEKASSEEIESKIYIINIEEVLKNSGVKDINIQDLIITLTQEGANNGELIDIGNNMLQFIPRASTDCNYVNLTISTSDNIFNLIVDIPLENFYIKEGMQDTKEFEFSSFKFNDLSNEVILLAEKETIVVENYGFSNIEIGIGSGLVAVGSALAFGSSSSSSSSSSS